MIDRPNPDEGIGASVVPAIAGASPWATPVGVWLGAMGLATRSADTPSMSAGRALERPILALTADALGRRIVHNRRSFKHADWPRVRLWATPDGFTDHRRELVEVKVVGHRFGDWSDGPPAYVNLQVQAQLACLPRVREAIVAALVGGELRTFRVPRDPVIQADLPGLVTEWWSRHVLGQLAPDAAGPDDRWALLRVQAAGVGRPTRIATEAEAAIGGELLVLMRHADEVAAQVDERRLRLAESAAGSDVEGDGWRARWTDRRNVAWRALVDDLGIDEATVERFTSTTPTFGVRRTSTINRGNEASIDVLGFVPAGTFGGPPR